MNMGDFRRTLKSQYHASMAMLREAIERCPDAVWFSKKHVNAFWQIAYHTLYFTQLYLGKNPEAFRGWSGHQANVQHPDGFEMPADPKSPLPLIPEPYTRAQVLEYCNVVDSMIDNAVDAMDLANPECGFWWYEVSKLEHQLINLRHLQHGAAQLADRLRAELNFGVDWVGSGSEAKRSASGGA